MAIAVTYLERSPAGPRNALTLFDCCGREALTYAKVHTCSFDLPEQALAPGAEFPVARLETGAGPVVVGAMICFDREFPESARILMLKGAEIIITPNACELEANRLGQFRARAYENMVGVAMANYAAPQENGHSTVVDPIAFDAEGRSRDTRVFEAGEAEERLSSSASISARCASGAAGRCGAASAGARRPTVRSSSHAARRTTTTRGG